MKITKNTSPYDTKALRSILCKIHNHMKKLEGRPAPNWKNLRVVIRNRSHTISGWAYLNGSGCDWDVLLSLSPNVTEHDVGWLAYHEFMHTYGYTHDKYSNIPKKELKEIFPENNFVPKKQKKKKKTRPVWIKRYLSNKTRQKQWEGKLKRAENALKKINKTIKYYESKYDLSEYDL